MITFVGLAHGQNAVILYYTLQEGKNTFFKATVSNDGFSFADKSVYTFALDTLLKEEQTYDWKSFRVTKQDSTYFLTYKKNNDKTDTVYGALSADFALWQELGKIKGLTQTTALVPDYQYKEKFVAYTGEKEIYLAQSKDLTTWTKIGKPVLAPRKADFDNGALEVSHVYDIHGSILVVYFVKKGEGTNTRYSIGAAYFDRDNPSKLIWRSDEPLYEPPDEFYKDTIKPLGSAILGNELIIYWSVNDNSLFSVACPIPKPTDTPKNKTFSHIVKKYDHNPILAPRPHIPWDSRAAFNTAAIYEDGKVHFLYRALGDTDLSVLGYATSTDGVHIDHRSDQPAYIPRAPFETPGNHAFSTLAQHFVSGGGYGGVEDPRITRVEDKVYLTYVAFDGANPPRAAMSSIHIDDFLKNDWDKWDEPKLISAPGMVNKSAVVLPRKVRGKYVVMHRVYPNILVDYLDDLAFDSYLQGHHFIPPRKKFWDSKKVGAGAPPMETKDGWLLIYQSVGYQDPSRYKIGAMMLDRDHPEKVLYRTHVPIIEPNEGYENNGFKAGVVYPCGAVIIKDKLHVYYGGADTVVCGASANLDTFLSEMKQQRQPVLRKVTGAFLN